MRKHRLLLACLPLIPPREGNTAGTWRRNRSRTITYEYTQNRSKDYTYTCPFPTNTYTSTSQSRDHVIMSELEMHFAWSTCPVVLLSTPHRLSFADPEIKRRVPFPGPGSSRILLEPPLEPTCRSSSLSFCFYFYYDYQSRTLVCSRCY